MWPQMRYNGEVESLAADSLIGIASVVVPPPKHVDPALFLATPIKSGGLTADTTPSEWSDRHQELLASDDGRRNSHASLPAEDIDQQDIGKESEEIVIAESDEATDTPISPPIVADDDTENENDEGEQETIEYQAYLHSVSTAASQEASSSLPVDSPAIQHASPYNPFDDEDTDSPRISGEHRNSEDSESVVCKVLSER